MEGYQHLTTNILVPEEWPINVFRKFFRILAEQMIENGTPDAPGVWMVKNVAAKLERADVKPKFIFKKCTGK